MGHAEWLILMSHESWICYHKLDTKSNLAHPWRAIRDQFKPRLWYSRISATDLKNGSGGPYGPWVRPLDPGGSLGPSSLNRLAISFYLFYPFLLEPKIEQNWVSIRGPWDGTSYLESSHGVLVLIKLKLPSSGFSLIDVPMNEALWRAFCLL